MEDAGKWGLWYNFSMKKRIVFAQEFLLSEIQIEKLRKLGDFILFTDVAKSPEEWLERVKGADIISSGSFGLKQNITRLQNLFLSLPFVGTGWLDKELMKKRGVIISNAPGCNTEAVSEWCIGMLITLLRELPSQTNQSPMSTYRFPKQTRSLSGEKVSILGAGNVGRMVGNLCQAFGMHVTYFNRGDSLFETTAHADIIVNCLSLNPETKGLLDASFFSQMKLNSVFISISYSETYDTKALINSLGKNVSGAALDFGDIQVGNSNDIEYQRISQHPLIFATPHIAFNTDVTTQKTNDMVIANIEAYLSGKPINLI